MIGELARGTGASVRRVCAVLGLPRSSYHHAATVPEPRRRDLRLAVLAGEIFLENRGCYGYRRIVRELARRGIACGCQRPSAASCAGRV